MTNFFCVRMKNNEVLQYGLDNHLFAMQQQYGHQTTQTVTTLWNRISGIKQGDWLVAIQAGVFAYALGKVVPPRFQANHTDTINRTTTQRNHTYSSGIVHYDDCNIFYENFNDPPAWSGEYAQRIDVEEWLYLNREGVRVYNLNSNIFDVISQECILPITAELFDEIRKNLKGGYMKNPKNIQRQALNTHRQIILQGPPGTSKTWTAKELTARLLKIGPAQLDQKRYSMKNGQGQWSIVQFHPSYNYEDFVRGIQVTTAGTNIAYQTVNRILGKMAESARKAMPANQNNPPSTAEDSEDRTAESTEKAAPPYILIIDEINRANMAAVLGELIYALEYRNEAVDTPYDVNGDFSLSIPSNLYIIGTMNTADRSIGHIDYAVRRRFVFIPCLPDVKTLESFYLTRYPNENHLKDVALLLFHSVENLFLDSDNGGNLTPDFYKDDVQVGHTYFMAKDCEELAMKFAYQVYPLLREYYKDGILIARGDGKIEIKIVTTSQGQSPDMSFRIDTPQKSEEIFKKVLQLCSGMSSESIPESEEELMTSGESETPGQKDIPETDKDDQDALNE